ncbi:MAG TPA: hypothetical protein VKE74_36365, partial [Gemmataceae bacterium]|nr:hypothetical protein [Gemmataceae bacterium]
VPSPLEGGPVSPKPTPKPQSAPVPPPPVVRLTKHALTLNGQWYSRPAGNPDAAWSAQPVKLPGEVTVKPNETYRLTLNPAQATDAELARLKVLNGVPGLEAVDLSGCEKVTDAGLSHVAALCGVKAVALADTAVTDSGVALLLTRLRDLEAVSLSGCESVSQAVVPYLARQRKLKAVSLPPRADTIDVRVELARRLPSCKVV